MGPEISFKVQHNEQFRLKKYIKLIIIKIAVISFSIGFSKSCKYGVRHLHKSICESCV